MKFYAVIDTNVLVSAMLSRHRDSATVRVLRSIQSGDIRPLVHEDIIKEYREVLARPKFKLPQQVVQSIVGIIEFDGLNVEPVPSDDEIPDPKDVVFDEVALSKDDAFLVTGNLKHFPRKPIVVTPAEMMKILDNLNKQL